MGIITVSLSAAILCFSNICHPVLVGKATPLGTYQLTDRPTNDPGYGGDVLVFKQVGKVSYAIHRVWLLHPQDHRLERLASKNVKDRVGITHGCINVQPELYDQIKHATIVQITP